MELRSCPICYSIYSERPSESKCSAYVLECGHDICSVCAQKNGAFINLEELHEDIALENDYLEHVYTQKCPMCRFVSENWCHSLGLGQQNDAMKEMLETRDPKRLREENIQIKAANAHLCRQSIEDRNACMDMKYSLRTEKQDKLRLALDLREVRTLMMKIKRELETVLLRPEPPQKRPRARRGSGAPASPAQPVGAGGGEAPPPISESAQPPASGSDAAPIPTE